MKEIKVYSNSHQWKNEQLKDMEQALDELQDRVEELYNNDMDTFEKLAVWKALEEYRKLFENWVIAGGSVNVELSEEMVDELDYYLSLDSLDIEFSLSEDFERRFSRIANHVLSLDGTTLDEEEVEELQEKVEALDVVKNDYGLDGVECNEECLKDLKREIRKHLRQVKTKFFEPKLELDEELVEELKGIAAVEEEEEEV